MIRETVNALLACVVTFALCAVAYPALVYGLGHTMFPKQAEGSLIERDGKTIGSKLIAQPFASEKYFSPRPSAAGASGYAADAASGSNLGTTNPALHDRIALDAAKQVLQKTGDADLKAKLERLDSLQGDLKAKNDEKEKSKADEEAIAKLTEQVTAAQTQVNDRAAELGKTAGNEVPVDLVTASGAGLDPDISPEGARYQSARVAAARKLPVGRVLKLIDEHTNTSGAIIGAPPRVNVLELNLALDNEPASTAANVPPAAASAASKTAHIDPAPAPEVKPSGPATGAAEPSAIEALSRRLDALQARVAAVPAETLASDVKELKGQVARLVSSANDEATARRLGELDGRVAGFGRELQAIRADLKAARETSRPDERLAALPDEVKALKAQVASIRTSIKSDAMARPESTLDLGPATALFRARKFADAAAAFRALSASHPEDARVWYFSALAEGISTQKWRGEVEDLVKKGMDREKAGTPSAAQIDAAFAGLTSDTGKEWLAYYRSKAIQR